MRKLNFWNNILGFTPDKLFEPVSFKSKCYNCESKEIEKLDSDSWTGKYKCNDCKYYTYVLFTDRMGGGMTDSVAISLQNSSSI